MLLPIVLAAIVLLSLVSNYTFIHILLGTAVVWVLTRLAYRPHLIDPLPKDSCVPLANSGS
jgi:hypothetical protein